MRCGNPFGFLRIFSSIASVDTYKICPSLCYVFLCPVLPKVVQSETTVVVLALRGTLVLSFKISVFFKS